MTMTIQMILMVRLLLFFSRSETGSNMCASG